MVITRRRFFGISALAALAPAWSPAARGAGGRAEAAAWPGYDASVVIDGLGGLGEPGSCA